MPAASTEYNNGAVTFLDVLGWKGIWLKNLDAIGQLRRFVEDVKIWAQTAAEDLAPQYEELRGIETQVLSISDTIAMFSTGMAPGALALHAAICNQVLPESVYRQLPIRGATSYGEFLIDVNIMRGQAVDEAASWHESCDWIGVHLTPAAYLKVERQLPLGWIEYEPPYKSYKYGKTGCVEWNYQNRPESIEQRFFTLGPHDPGIAHKYLNTLKFLDKVSSTETPDQQYRLRFETAKPLARRGSFISLALTFSILPIEKIELPDEKTFLKFVTVEAKLTDTLFACWSKKRKIELTDDERNLIVYEYSWREIKQRVERGDAIPDEFELLLATHNKPTELEFEPDKIQVKPGYVEVVTGKMRNK